MIERGLTRGFDIADWIALISRSISLMLCIWRSLRDSEYRRRLEVRSTRAVQDVEGDGIVGTGADAIVECALALDDGFESTPDR